MMAYAEVKVPQVADARIIEQFKDAVRLEPAIISCYITAGQFDFLLKVIAPYGCLFRSRLERAAPFFRRTGYAFQTRA
jgi:Lrp/AsnC ligand binding domain